MDTLRAGETRAREGEVTDLAANAACRAALLLSADRFRGEVMSAEEEEEVEEEVSGEVGWRGGEVEPTRSCGTTDVGGRVSEGLASASVPVPPRDRLVANVLSRFRTEVERVRSSEEEADEPPPAPSPPAMGLI
jgi:hypothetical protein